MQSTSIVKVIGKFVFPKEEWETWSPLRDTPKDGTTMVCVVGDDSCQNHDNGPVGSDIEVSFGSPQDSMGNLTINSYNEASTQAPQAVVEPQNESIQTGKGDGESLVH